MNLLYFTQSRSLDVFYQIHRRLEKQSKADRAGFYIANLSHYETFLRDNPDFEDRFSVVKEWEIVARAENHKPDLERIARYEAQIGDPFLWSPIVTDRRLFLGKKASIRQDYRPRFPHGRRLAILDIALQEIGRLFDEVNPDAVATIYTATFGDCLGHQFAAARGTRALDLRLARLKNHVMFADGVSEPPPHIAAIHESFRETGVPEDLAREAEDYIESVVTKHAMYEGVLPAGEKRAAASSGSRRAAPGGMSARLRQTAGAFRHWRKLKKPPHCHDLQQQDPLMHAVYRRFLNPFNLWRIRRALGGQLVRKEDLSELDFALYPLHVEPETVISQFARPYLNQIEAIRNIAMSLPVGMTLLVKDHPMMTAKRTLGYYKKILEIPNVRLADFSLASESVLPRARLVVILRGAIGLEAVLKRIPVVCMGKAMFSLLPERMFKTCYNPYELPAAVDFILRNYEYNHGALVRYLAAVIRGSAPANLVTDLLGKSGRHREGIEGGDVPFEEHPHLDVLTDYFLRRLERRDEPAPVEGVL